ncbi:MAG: MFS transporter [Clostridiales bacterium]|nr:MFS transporter [Clostridiales bacterium]
MSETLQKRYVGKKELWMFSIGGMGQGMIYAMMSSYISDYYVNVLQLPLIFALMLMLLARVWDAINDPIMGVIVDRHQTKWGKFKPYILFAAPFIAILTVLMYISPTFKDDPNKTKLMVFCAVVYVLWGMIYTMADVPFWSFPNVITPNADERSHVVSFSKIWNSVGSALPEIIFFILPFILPMFMGTNEGLEYTKATYRVLSITVVVLGSIMYVNSYFHIKERAVPPPTKKVEGEPSTIKRVFTCKPLLLIIAMGILSSGRYMVQAAAIHVARYAFYIGPDLKGMTQEQINEAVTKSVSSVKTIFQLCAVVGMFGATILMPKLMQKFDYKKLLISTCLAGFVASIGTTLIGWFTNNLYICIPFILIQCIPLGVINTLSIAMIYDCLDYMELKTGHRDNALGSACQGLINKFGSAFSTCGIIVMYMFIGFKPEDMLNNTVIRPATELLRTQNFAMFSLVSLVPGLSMLLCSIPMFFYKLSGENKKKMQKELQEKRAAEGFTVNE